MEQDIVGNIAFDLVPQKSRKKLKTIFTEVMQSGQPQSFFTEYHTGEGQVRSFEGTASCFQRNGKNSGLIIQANEISKME